ncbi:MAG: PD-(D/E)XK nuclease family protein [Zoogloeaceae bacterium]|jgi:RecB family exonuclease|nr:PD-(D/E)XK nuclease family protein [Zoogloeaceae bacterium]
MSNLSTTTPPNAAPSNANPVASWSFSRLMVFEQCACRYKLEFIDKLPTPPKPAADRGTEIHAIAERYVKGDGPPTPELKHFEMEFRKLRQLHAENKVTCEEQWAFDSEWKPTQWTSGWLRLKCDAVAQLTRAHLAVIDYKTGRRFGNEIKHARQLELYALCALLRNPDAREVTCELWYLDKDEMTTFHCHRAQVENYLRIYDRAGRRLTECREWPPSFNCQYCPFHEKECEHTCQKNTTLPARTAHMLGRLL